MIEVRIRHEGEVVSRHLCTWEASALLQLLPMIQEWGILDAEDHALFGQFVVDDARAFFEVVIADDTE